MLSKVLLFSVLVYGGEYDFLFALFRSINNSATSVAVAVAIVARLVLLNDAKLQHFLTLANISTRNFCAHTSKHLAAVVEPGRCTTAS